MGNKILFTLQLLLVVLLFYRERKQRLRIKESLCVLDEIMLGNENRRIFIGASEPLAPLIFKINQLVDSYQKDKIRIYRTEQERKQLLSNLSHDVRTPLTSVLGYLDALSGDLAGDEAEEYLQIARAKAYTLKEYIDELFIMAQIDADEVELAMEPLDLYELLRTELIGWVPRLNQEKIILELEIPDQECFVVGDQHALIRIFNNLLQNALRYGGNNGFIGVTAWEDAEFAHFFVWDRGPGLSPEQISQAFSRLYKSDASRATGGHGLGLAIAKELVERLEGRISMESKPNLKTKVQVSLPKSKKKVRNV